MNFLPTTMLSAVRHAYGPPERIELTELPVPKLREDEILVRVRATTVNRTDCANLTGKPAVMHLVLGIGTPRRPRIGTDFAGEVVAAGGSVTGYRVGDRVCGFRDTGLGSQAEYLTVKGDGPIMAVPEGLSYAEAAASLEGAHYAYAMVRRADIPPGARVMINGATGAIGSALLQFAVARGALVTVTARESDHATVRKLGAAAAIDYTRVDFTQARETFDYVFDAVGKSTFGACRSLLNERGLYVSSEAGPYLQNVGYALLTPLRRGRRVQFPVPFPTGESFPFIRHHLSEGSFRPLLDARAFGLRDVRDAYRYVLTGEKRGNVILNV